MRFCTWRGTIAKAILRPATARSGLQARVVPDGHFDARKPAENQGFFGPLWHMEDIAS